MKYIVLAFVFITFGSKVVSQTNVALNQTYDAVSDTANVGYVFDGLNDSNYWAALTYTGWVSVVFDFPSKVDSLKFYYNASPGNTTTQEIYTTVDGLSWVLHSTINLVFNSTLSPGGINTADSISYVFPIPINSTRGIKVKTIQNSSWVNWSEIKVLGNSFITGITEQSLEKKRIIKILDFTGREVDFKSNTPLIYIFSDGTSEKVFQVE